VTSDYDDDRRFCPQCIEYVRYLRSPEDSYCVQCASRTRLFSESDHQAFLRSLRSYSSGAALPLADLIAGLAVR
jgi:hypothetical protein